MDRIDRMTAHPLFRDCMDRIVQAERDRIFCLHGMEHSLDVARIGYIIALEERLHIDKETIYAAALLHDLGRCMEYEKDIPHHQAGAEIAERILTDSGFDRKETEEICRAILEHKELCGEDGAKDLSYLLYSADKLSRNCFSCKAREGCYWQEDRKNRHIVL